MQHYNRTWLHFNAFYVFRHNHKHSHTTPCDHAGRHWVAHFRWGLPIGNPTLQGVKHMKDYTQIKNLIKASLALLEVQKVVGEYQCGKLARSIREKRKLSQRLTDAHSVWENARKGVTK